MVPLVVFGHALARMTSDLLLILSGFLLQVHRQSSHFVEAWHLLFLPSRVAARRLADRLERSRQI